MIRLSFPLSTVAAVLPVIKGKGERVGEREERDSKASAFPIQGSCTNNFAIFLFA